MALTGIALVQMTFSLSQLDGVGRGDNDDLFDDCRWRELFFDDRGIRMDPHLFLRFTFEETDLPNRTVDLDHPSSVIIGIEFLHTNDFAESESTSPLILRGVESELVEGAQFFVIDVQEMPTEVLAETQMKVDLGVVTSSETIVKD